MGRYLRAQIAALRAVFPQGPGTAAVGRKTRRFDFAYHNRFFNRLFLLVFRMADFWTLSGRCGNGCASVFLAQPTSQHHRRNRDVHDSSSHLKRNSFSLYDPRSRLVRLNSTTADASSPLLLSPIASIASNLFFLMTAYSLPHPTANSQAYTVNTLIPLFLG